MKESIKIFTKYFIFYKFPCEIFKFFGKIFRTFVNIFLHLFYLSIGYIFVFILSFYDGFSNKNTLEEYEITFSGKNRLKENV